MFSKELDSKQQLAQQREAVSSRGMCVENWGLGITCPEMGGLCLHRRSPLHTHCLTKRAASLPSLFLVGTGRKGNSGAKPPAPAAAASTHSTWCGGTGGAPSTRASGRRRNASSHLPTQIQGPDGAWSQRTCSGLPNGEAVPPACLTPRSCWRCPAREDGRGRSRPSLVS